MAGAANDDDLPEWWKKLTAEEQARFRRIMGQDWQPEQTPPDIEHLLDITRERIRQIEQRALKKLRGDPDDDKK